MNKSKKTPKAKPKYDWDAIERRYSLNIDSFRILEAKFGPSKGEICKRAKREGWRKDQAGEVRDLTAAALLKETANGNAVGNGGNVATKEEITEAVATNVHIVLGHRKHIKKGFDIAERLEDQLKKAVGDSKTFDPQNITSLKELTLILKNVIPLERQAYSLDAESALDKAAGSVADAIKEAEACRSK
jgi:hypothetical protein